MFCLCAYTKVEGNPGAALDRNNHKKQYNNEPRLIKLIEKPANI